MSHSVIKKNAVRVAGAASVSAGVAAASVAHSKSVRLVRIEGVVRLIELTCSCGETSVVELDYADESGGQR